MSLATRTYASITLGAALTFETVASCTEDRPPMRHRAGEDVLLRVIDGLLEMKLDGEPEPRLLQPGEEAIIPAGIAHRLGGSGGEARFLVGYRAAA
jgi:quercetin dioxygenase-like cupin family protein